MMAPIFPNVDGTGAMVQPKRPGLPVPALLLLAFMWSFQSLAAVTASRTQVIELKKGWNAVWLEVAPTDTDPAKVFGGTTVDIAATYFQNVTPVQFIKDPRESPWKEPGWGVWYSGKRPDAFVTDLFAVHANRAYLVHATEAFRWELNGLVEFKRIQWQPDSFNFVGFSVNPDALPSFDSFLSDSPAHRGQKIYQMDNEQWLAVDSPANVRIESGKAYWVYCKGGSQYQGPVDVRPPFGGQFDFGSSSTSLGIRFENNSSTPARLTVESSPQLNPVPLAYVVRNLSTLSTSYPRLPNALTLAPLPPGDNDTLTLQVRRETLSPGTREGLLRVTTDRGSQYWIPVAASRIGTSIVTSTSTTQP